MFLIDVFSACWKFDQINKRFSAFFWALLREASKYWSMLQVTRV